MPTEFRNIKFNNAGTEGKIETVSTLPVWNCYKKEWSSAPQVVIRNAMLFALYPCREFVIGEIDKDTKINKAYVLNPFKTKEKIYRLDLASNSRTHGRFTFVQAQKQNDTVGQYYFGENWKRIIYGSILHTGCNRMFYRQMKYIVVDDERYIEGEQQDDPTNKLNWNSGDCHAKASNRLMALLEAFEQNEDTDPTDPNKPIPIDIDPRNPDRPITVQFRASLFKGWVTKGTMSYHPRFDYDNRFEDYDLVIPLSCFKGNKPALGNYEGKILIGVVHEAEERRAKPGWMLWQWFDFETLEKDGIITKLRAKCEELGAALDSMQKLAQILRIDLEEAEKELANKNDSPDAEVAYVDVVLKIIKADKAGVLLLHPYVILKVKQRLQEIWKNLAKAAGVRFYSVMCTPDTYLEKYENKVNGEVQFEEKVFCSKSFRPGEYIVFCNPMRHWGDVQLWENRLEGNFKRSSGTLAASRELLLSLGRDTDGDFVQLVWSKKYPTIREAIANFSPSPKVKKFPKVPLTGHFQVIAINSMNDLTGVVASLLGRARANSAENIILNIPGEGEMRIIDFLSQELQIAVDSLKSAYPNNEEGLKSVTQYLNGIENSDVMWLKDLKSDNCYSTRPCLTNSALNDTITRIINIVNSYWRYPNLGADTKPDTYKYTLFSKVQTSPEQEFVATRERDNYREEMAAAIAYRNEKDDDRLIKETTEKFRANSEKIISQIINPATNKPYLPASWAAAYWRACMTAKTGTGGLVFLLFCDEIIAELMKKDHTKPMILVVFAVQYTVFKRYFHSPWNGEELTVRSTFETINGKQRISLEGKFDCWNGFQHLGLVGEKFIGNVPNGWTGRMKIYPKAHENDKIPARRSVDDICTSVYLFDGNLPQEDIDNFLKEDAQENPRFLNGAEITRYPGYSKGELNYKNQKIWLEDSKNYPNKKFLGNVIYNKETGKWIEDSSLPSIPFHWLEIAKSTALKFKNPNFNPNCCFVSTDYKIDFDITSNSIVYIIGDTVTANLRKKDSDFNEEILLSSGVGFLLYGSYFLSNNFKILKDTSPPCLTFKIVVFLEIVLG